MYNNYFFLKSVCEEISKAWKNYEISASFSQNKNELVIESTSEEYPYLKIDLSPTFSCISFQEKFSRARKNTIDIFPELIGKKIEKVEVLEYDRSFTISLEQNVKLIVQLHGSRSNAILLRADSELVSFKKSMSDRIEVEPRIMKVPDENHYMESKGNLRELFPVLGGDLIKEIEDKSENINHSWQLFTEKLDSLNTAKKFYVEISREVVKLNFLDANKNSEIENDIHIFDSAVGALNFFYRENSRFLYLKRKKAAALKGLKTEHKKIKSMLIKQMKRLKFLQENVDADYKKVADILMANMHAIKPNSKIVDLFDFEGNPITIKLDPAKSVVTIAENYYRKSKKQHIEESSLNDAISSFLLKETELNHSIEQVKNASRIEDFTELKSNKLNQKKPKLFHEYYFKGYNIYVGKNAKNNDVLTFEYGTKNDLWLHAKDEKGSHVIIKQIPGTGFPETVIEYAAKLAALNSKRKTDSLVPVIYIERKYVRKKKGLPPGAVIVERENVILVKPELP